PGDDHERAHDFFLARYLHGRSLGRANSRSERGDQCRETSARHCLQGPSGSATTRNALGDSSQPGLYVDRIKFQPGMKVMPHWHPDTVRTVLVMSGTFYFAVGEQWDESKLKAYPAGTLYSEPARSPHYAWAKDGEVILQVTAIGQTGNVPIPQKSQQ